MIQHLLICGLGSIGRRHLRHFRALGVERVDAYRTCLATLDTPLDSVLDYEYSDLDAALAEKPQAVVVCNPTAFHMGTALKAVRAGCHVLVEKPLSHSMAGVEELVREVDRAGVVLSVAQNLRYHPVLQRIREFVNDDGPLGQVLFVRSHSGAYLPAWHPWEDYRVSYAARRSLGGGCRLTQIHEVDLVLWMLGPVQECSAMEMALRPLGTDVDEAVGFLCRHNNGALSVISLSFAQSPPTRTLDLSFEGGTVHADLISGLWEVCSHDGKRVGGAPPQGFDIDNTYRDQAADFLRAVAGDILVPVPLGEAIAALRVTLTGRGEN